MRRATVPTVAVSAPRAACMDDVMGLLFADEQAYANFASWLEADLMLLELRFAEYSTRDSLQEGSGRRSGRE